jgi:ribonucleoside-diphosphate reductase alpha chain
MDDMEMMSCKAGEWYIDNPQRGRANNSAVILRHRATKDDFLKLWERVEASGSGEPGVYFSNDKDWGTNPCCEIGLRPYQFCNLVELNVSDITSQEDLNERSKAAALIGTLQAGYTDFHYLRDVWKEATERDALIGVGQTGIGSGVILSYDLAEAAEIVKEENERVAGLLNINVSARCTTVKPSGTSSCVLGTSSGIHAWHNDYYIRRQRLGKNEALYQHLAKHHPELVEDEFFNPEQQAVVEIPQKAPEGSILRTENALDLLERVRLFNTDWVQTGHREGQNSHNVSCTISVKDDEWPDVGEWMWKNRNTFNGIAVLPYNGGTYTQAPFEEITEERFNMLASSLNELDLTKVIEAEDETDLSGEAACAGGACEII